MQTLLSSPFAKKATYLFTKIQNKIISIIGYDILQANLTDEILKKGTFQLS